MIRAPASTIRSWALLHLHFEGQTFEVQEPVEATMFLFKAQRGGLCPRKGGPSPGWQGLICQQEGLLLAYGGVHALPRDLVVYKSDI